jgi:hypothetical protein
VQVDHPVAVGGQREQLGPEAGAAELGEERQHLLDAGLRAGERVVAGDRPADVGREEPAQRRQVARAVGRVVLADERDVGVLPALGPRAAGAQRSGQHRAGARTP